MFSHLFDFITQLVTNLYLVTGIFGIIFAMALESCCLPIPSEVVMPIAGVMIATHHRLLSLDPSWPMWEKLVIVALAGSLGCLLGSIAAYLIGASGGRPLLLKYGRYILISEHDARRADQFFQRWGNAAAFFSRLLPVVRTYISLPAGIARAPFGSFCVFTFLGSFPWCLVLAYAGARLGQNLGTVSAALRWLTIFVLALAAISIALYIWQHLRARRLEDTGEKKGEEK
jgi:membrane protein DedA with SNARE-associated domain